MVLPNSPITFQIATRGGFVRVEYDRSLSVGQFQNSFRPAPNTRFSLVPIGQKFAIRSVSGSFISVMPDGFVRACADNPELWELVETVLQDPPGHGKASSARAYI